MGTNFNIEAAKTCEKREARDSFKNENKVNTRFRVILAGDHVLHTHIQYIHAVLWCRWVHFKGLAAACLGKHPNQGG